MKNRQGCKAVPLCNKSAPLVAKLPHSRRYQLLPHGIQSVWSSLKL